MLQAARNTLVSLIRPNPGEVKRMWRGNRRVDGLPVALIPLWALWLMLRSGLL